MKLLIIEDDVPFAQTLARRLTTHHFDCVVCHNASEVLAYCHTHQPAYILLDMNLEGESGLRLLTPIKQCLPQSKVVLLTGFASIATAVEAMRLGADDYLAKPVTTKMLLKSLGGNLEVDNKTLDVSSTMSPDRVEWEHIQQMLASNNGNVSATARQLNMHRRTLQRKLQKKPVAK